MAGVVALVGLLGLAVLLLLGTHAGTDWLLRRALRVYDDAMPGTITVERTRGDLLGELCFEGLRLADAAGRPLVTVSHACTRVDLGAALRGEVELRSLWIAGGRVDLYERSSWGDLAPPSEEPEVAGPPGPDLPLRLGARVLVQGLEVWRHDGDSEVLADEVGFVGRIDGEGTHATAHLDRLWGVLGAEVVVADELAVDWRAPMATVRGRVRVDGYGEADLDLRLAATDALRFGAIVDARPSEVAPLHLWTKGTIGDDVRQVVLRATGGRTRLTATLQGDRAQARLRLPGARARLVATLRDGQPEQLDASLRLDDAAAVRGELERWLPWEVPELPPLRGWLDVGCDPADWRCTARARIVRGDDEVALQGSVHPVGDAFDVELPTLHGRLGGERLAIVRPASARVSADRIEDLDVSLSVAGGVVEARGAVELEGPVDLTVRLRDIELAPLLADVVRLRGRVGGRVALRGRMAAPNLDVDLEAHRLAWDGHAIGRVQLEAQLHEGRAVEATASVRPDGGGLVRVSVEAPLRLDLAAPALELPDRGLATARVRARALPLRTLDPWLGDLDLRGRLTADVRAAGPWRDPSIVATVGIRGLGVQGKWVGHVEVRAALADDRALGMASLRRVRGGEAVVRVEVPLHVDLAEGRVTLDDDRTQRLAIAVDQLELASLSPWIDQPELQGLAFGRAVVLVDDATPRGRAWVLGHRLELGAQPLGSIQAELVLDGDELLAHVLGSSTRTRLLEARARVPVDASRLTTSPLRAEGCVSAWAQLRSFDAASIAALTESRLSGEVDGTVKLGGTLADPQLYADLGVRRFFVRDASLGRMRAQATYTAGRLRARLEQRQGAQYLRADASVPVEVALTRGRVRWRPDQRQQLELRATSIDDRTLAPFVELPSDTDLLAHVRADVAGPMDDLLARVELRGEVRTQGQRPVPFHLALRSEHDEQHARVYVGGSGPTGLVAEGHAKLDLLAWLEGRVDPRELPLTVEAQARDYPLSSLTTLVPRILRSGEGTIELDASLTGTLADPEVEGALTIRDGALTVVALNQRFTAIEARAELRGSDLELASLRARSGEGSLSATAFVHAAPGDTWGRARVQTRDLPIMRPGLPLMLLDTTVGVDVDARGDRTRVEIAVSDSMVDVLETSLLADPERIPTDQGVRFAHVTASTSEEPADREPWIPRDVVVDVKLRDPVRIRGPQADMTWDGRVTVQRSADGTTEASGSLRAGDGWIALVGNDFDLEHGEVTLPAQGDLDPFLDLTAVTETSEATVTMQVRGRMSRPTLELSSDPSMSQPDIFALLVTGHADARQAAEGDYGAKLSSLLAAVQNPVLQQSLRKQLGIDRVGIGFGETVEEPILTVGKRLSRKVYVEAEYHHNAPPQDNQAELRLQYSIDPHWTLETSIGDAAQGEIGVWWQRRFGAGAGGAARGDQGPAAAPSGGSR